MEECFEDNVVICNQDEMGDKFYLIKDGTAVCTQKGLDGEFRKVLELSTGAYFGEVSVVVNYVSSYFTAICMSHAMYVFRLHC